MRINIKKMILSIGALLFIGGVRGATVTPEMAGKAAGRWLDRGRVLDRSLGSYGTVKGSFTVTEKNGAKYNVVEFSGGGFVVTSADTGIAPIIAFSSKGEFPSEGPLASLLSNDLRSRQKALPNKHNYATQKFNDGSVQRQEASSKAEAEWRELLADDDNGNSIRSLHYAIGRGSVSDLLVAPLIESQWAQSGYRNTYGEPAANNCYNYYTPNNYACGCSATAGAQLMRFHQYPKSVTAGSYQCQVDGFDVKLPMIGGTYDYSSMPLIPAHGCSDVQREAIGKLTYDVGVAALTAYTSRGSGAPMYMLGPRLVDRFKYANAYVAFFNDKPGWVSYSLEKLKDVVIPNLHARWPVLIGLDSIYGGHAAIVDGYGYSNGDFWIHVNLGWAGIEDAWYMPPDISDYNAIDTLVYNIIPTLISDATLICGRVTKNGAPVSGAEIVVVRSQGCKAAQTYTYPNGYYTVPVKAGTYSITASIGGSSGEIKNLKVKGCVSIDVTNDGSVTTAKDMAISNMRNVDIELSGAGADIPDIPSGGDGESDKDDEADKDDDPGKDDAPDKEDPPEEEEEEEEEEEPFTLECAGLSGFMMTGVSLGGDDFNVVVSDASDIKKIAVKGLPSGVKLVQDRKTKTYSLQGVPKKAVKGKATFTVTFKTKGRAAQKIEIPYTVEALPTSLSSGTFNGFVVRPNDDTNDLDYVCSADAITKIANVTITVKSGKITAKVYTATKTWNFSAKGWNGVEKLEDGGYVASLEITGKKKEYLALNLYSSDEWARWHVKGEFASPDGVEGSVLAQRNSFVKDGKTPANAEATALLAKLVGKYQYDVVTDENESYLVPSSAKKGAISVSVDKKGNVKISGKVDAFRINAKTTVMFFRDCSLDVAIADVMVPVKIGKTKYAAEFWLNLYTEDVLDDNHGGFWLVD